MNLNERQNKLLATFEGLSDWEQKYERIITFGKNLPPFDEQYRKEDFKVRGCQSQVWLFAKLDQGRIHFFADSDALIVKGLIGLLLEIYQNCLPGELLSSDLSFFEKIGLSTHLSPNRANGFQAMFKQMKMYAVAFQYQLNQKG